MNPSQSTPGQGQAGLYRLAASDLPALREAAEMLGQAFYLVDLSRARNVPGFIKAMQRDLGFPEPFGRNLDALHDCLTDLSWHPAPGYIITLENSEGLRANPTSFAMFNEILASAADAWQSRNVPFRVFYLLDEAQAIQPGHDVAGPQR